MNLFNKLTIKEQTKIYLIWCKDNDKESKQFDSLKAYFKEIKGN